MQAWQATVQDDRGNAVPNPVVTVYQENGTTISPIFNEAGTALPNPLTGTIDGFVQFFAGPGRRKISIAGGPTWDVDFGPVFATNAQATSGTSTTLFMNPSNTRAAIDARITSQVTPSLTSLRNRLDDAEDRLDDAEADIISAEGRLGDVEAQADAADLRFQNAIGTPIVVLAEGQSNMRSVPGQVGGDLSINPNVFAWNSQAAPMRNGTAWVTATPGQNPFIGAADVNNLAFQFCKQLQVRTGRPVYLILVALGGHSIEAFMNSVDLSNNGWTRPSGDADLFTFAQTQLAAAMPLVPGSPNSLDYFIWHQGEANKEDQVELYARKFRTVLKRLETNGRIARNKTDIIAGELLIGANNGRYRVRHLSALQRLKIGTREDAFPRLKIARSRTLQPVTLTDDLHFSGDDLTALGKRYADAAFSEQTADELDPTLIDLSVDTGLGWATNAAAGQNQNTYERREPIYLTDTPVTIEDNASIGWSYLTPSNSPLTLVGRKMFRVPREAQFLIEVEVRNDHPTATANFRAGAYEYSSALAYQNNIVTPMQTVTAGNTARVAFTIGNSAGSRTNTVNFSSGAIWFAPTWQINPSGSGAGLRWNIIGMRWI